MAEASSSVVSDAEEQVQCAVCLDESVFPIVLPCAHIFCYLCVKGLGSTARTCPLCRHPFTAELEEHPTLLHPETVTRDSAGESGRHWSYRCHSGGFWKYEPRISRVIEEAYVAGEQQVEVLVCGHVYVVDFAEMVQFRQNQPGMTRAIRRTSARTGNLIGVAGIRFN